MACANHPFPRVTLAPAFYSHGRTLFAHYSRVHTPFAPSSHQIRTLFAPVRTPVTLFAPWGRARSHSITQYSCQFAQFTPIRICDVR